MRASILGVVLATLALTACSTDVSDPVSGSTHDATLALTNGTLIDGTGADPLPDAALLIDGVEIVAVGARGDVEIPSGTPTVDVQGGTILPGFINAHVHDAYSADNLVAWAQAGVTTVRDEGILSYGHSLSELIATRDSEWSGPQYARLVSAGWMISAPGGYGRLHVSSPEEGRQKVLDELDQGADLIKITVEDGYGSASNLPLMSFEELTAMVAAARERGAPVSAHITEAEFMQTVVDAGVDDVAHMAWDFVPAALIQQMIDEHIYVVSTMTVMEAYDCLAGAQSNLGRFAAAGGRVAMGNDYTDVPQNGFDHFELGMPMHEIMRMAGAGMSHAEIIVASTKHAAHVCNLGDELGTLEVGKVADVLVVNGDPLQDLDALMDVRLVIRAGTVIRDEGR